MKNIFILFLLLLVIASCEKEKNSPAESDITLTMGAGYENDIYYSLEDDSKQSANRAGWDIAFGTYVMSPSIIINSGNGIKLFEVSNDTSDYYNPVDTNGMASWTALQNSLELWDVGAFSANMGGGFNFGWGIYNHTTKNVNGAALYLIKLADNSVKKIFIRQKNGYENTVHFLFANIDGSDEQVVALSNNAYAGKEYIYYSLKDNAVADREPAKENWDLLFTKYFDTQINYIVTGVLSKPGVKVAKLTGVTPSEADTANATFVSAVAPIGYDWKEFDMQSNTYTIADDVSYFVKTTQGSVYQLYFTSFEGAATGNLGFSKKKIK
ncbi:MAG: hypothetical protein JXB00_19715 [Bacteroidales bacterium]|nr:hypothetical protein [Bacteroidales bacterium]